MNIRDFLVQLNEEEFVKQEDKTIAPAAMTLAPNSSDAAQGVETPEQANVDDESQEAQPTDGEDNAEQAEQPTEAPEATEEPEAEDDEDDEKKTSQAAYNAQTSLPEESVQESMTPEQKAKKEEIVKGMKANKADFKARYGDRAEEVMHATATKQAMSEEVDFQEAFKANLLEGAEYKASDFAIRTLMESQGLEQEFVTQSVQIFEEAIQTVAKANAEKMAGYAAYVMESVMAQKLSEMEDTLDARLNESVAAWAESNHIGIEQGVRVVVAEQFMDKLSSVLKEHFVAVPDLKKDLYEENLQVVSAQGVELKESKEEIEKLTAELNEAKKELFVESQMQGMTVLQKERIKELSKGLLFESAEDFKSKFEILKESIVEKKSAIDHQAILEDSVIIEQTKSEKKEHVDSFVAAIANSMGRFANK